MERNTRQRTAMRVAIAEAARPLLPQEVLEAAQAGAPGLSLATVYRNLRSMVDEGELRQVMLPGENARYELADHGHHHHFQCLGCQRVFDVHACPGDLAGLAPPGFTVEAHDLTLYGRCGDCAQASPRGPSAAAAEACDAQARGCAHDHCHEQRHEHRQPHAHDGCPAHGAAGSQATDAPRPRR